MIRRSLVVLAICACGLIVSGCGVFKRSVSKSAMEAKSHSTASMAVANTAKIVKSETKTKQTDSTGFVTRTIVGRVKPIDTVVIADEVATVVDGTTSAVAFVDESGKINLKVKVVPQLETETVTATGGKSVLATADHLEAKTETFARSEEVAVKKEASQRDIERRTDARSQGIPWWLWVAIVLIAAVIARKYWRAFV